MLDYLGNLMEDATDFSWDSAKACHAILPTEFHGMKNLTVSVGHILTFMSKVEVSVSRLLYYRVILAQPHSNLGLNLKHIDENQ